MLDLIIDLLRIGAIPIFGWAAYTDFRCRRVDGKIWRYLLIYGILITTFDLLFANPITTPEGIDHLRSVINITGILMLLGGILAHTGSVGLGDAKAIITLGIIYPVVPTLQFDGFTLPVVEGSISSLAVITLLNTALIGTWFVLKSFINGFKSWRLGYQITTKDIIAMEEITYKVGNISPTNQNSENQFRIDLDTIRQYMRWRKISLKEIRENKETLSDPASIIKTYEVQTGARTPHVEPDNGSAKTVLTREDIDEKIRDSDEWGAQLFINQLDKKLYDNDPEEIRKTLNYISNQDVVFISHGYPFVTVLFVGLVLGMIFGNIPHQIVTLYIIS